MKPPPRGVSSDKCIKCIYKLIELDLSLELDYRSQSSYSKFPIQSVPVQICPRLFTVPTCPLHVYKILVFINRHSVGYEVVLYCRVHLHNVSPLATDVEIIDVIILGDSILLPAAQLDDVTTILKRASILCSVDG